jgi:hypothetical protein
MGFARRIAYGFRCFFSLLLHGQIPSEIARELQPQTEQRRAAAAAAAVPVETSDRAVQILALLQRDGRLIDFLTEDVSPYPDAQLGAAVRALHEDCRTALNRYVTLEPIIDSEEGRPVAIGRELDPASVKLIGNVGGQPPTEGLLRHRGWRAKLVSLPPLPQASERSIIASAEVEIA